MGDDNWCNETRLLQYRFLPLNRAGKDKCPTEYGLVADEQDERRKGMMMREELGGGARVLVGPT